MRLEDFLKANAGRTPDAVAAMESDGRFATYADLDNRSEQVRSALTDLGVRPGDRVGLCARKGLPSLASVFGVLKAGGAYVPVDHSAPMRRNACIFDDCAVKAVIVESDKAQALIVELTDEWLQAPFPADFSEPSGLAILQRVGPSPQDSAADPDLAYILYTSGSTGRPKGVMHTHASALAFIDWCSDELKPTPADRFSSHAPFHFDLSILDIYVPIKHGASVVLIGSEAGKQPGTLAEIIEARGITVWYSTPSILRMLVEYGDLANRDCSVLRIVNYAGEVFPIRHLLALKALWPKPVYYNLYGPTETNVCTFFRLPDVLPAGPEASIPIGRVCSGDRARVVTAEGALAAPGQEGELLIAGGSVMTGYWNLPERNAEVFLPQDGEAWYRTGDIVRADADGDYVFLGRRDRMVKRRGYRVELGEIEAALHRHPQIPEAAVVAAPAGDGEIVVAAFLAWTDDKPPSIIKLKQFCAQNLPIYMVPDRFAVLPELPKTSTDKIDYQRLKESA